MSLGFKLYTFLNGKIIGKDVFGNTFYVDKKNSKKRWVIYSKGFGPESLPTGPHNWLHNTSDDLPLFSNDLNVNLNLVKTRVKKHEITKKVDKQGYSSWQPK